MVRSGVWSAQPVLALLTTCGTVAPRGLRSGTGADASGGAAAVTAASADRELVGPSEYPADESLAEMVDPYEALICWFYLPDGGSSESTGGGSGGGAKNGSVSGGTFRGGCGSSGDGSSGGGKGYGQGIACFVAYHDQGVRRQSGGGGERGERNSKKLADLEAKRAAIAARARGRKPYGGEDGHGGSQSSASSGGGSSSDSGSDDDGGGSGEEVDADDFEPAPLRVRVILASAGTTQQLRKATGAFLKTTRNRNPVSGDVQCALNSKRIHWPALDQPKSSPLPTLVLAHTTIAPPFTCCTRETHERITGEAGRPPRFCSTRPEHRTGSSEGFEGAAPARTGTERMSHCTTLPCRKPIRPTTPALQTFFLSIFLKRKRGVFRSTPGGIEDHQNIVHTLGALPGTKYGSAQANPYYCRRDSSLKTSPRAGFSPLYGHQSKTQVLFRNNVGSCLSTKRVGSFQKPFWTNATCHGHHRPTSNVV